MALVVSSIKLEKFTIPQVVHLFRQYGRLHPSWASLHILMEDGNVHDHHVEFCIESAVRDNDLDGYKLGHILLRMSKTQRLKLSYKIDNTYPNVTPLKWEDFSVYHVSELERSFVMLRSEVHAYHRLTHRPLLGYPHDDVAAMREYHANINPTYQYLRYPIVSAFRVVKVKQVDWLTSPIYPEYGLMDCVTVTDGRGNKRDVAMPLGSARPGDRIINDKYGILGVIKRKRFKKNYIRVMDIFYMTMARLSTDPLTQNVLRSELQVRGADLKGAERILRHRKGVHVHVWHH